MFCSGGNGDSGPLKSLILLQTRLGKETINLVDNESTKGDNKESHTQSWCTYNFVNLLRELMVLGIGPTNPLAWITL